MGGLVGRVQSSGVRGTLMCNGRPASRVLVKLYDDDRGLDMDDFMGETKSDSQGNFEVSGYIREMSPIDPKINIYHDCNDGIKAIHYFITMPEKNQHYDTGWIHHRRKTPRKWYNAGTIELAGKFAGKLVIAYIKKILIH
ncbi:Transthyretin-like protein 5 [Dirofilaria immitis]|nr:Transthyretin-like protein 5 [Dirofilaria immitis]